MATTINSIYNNSILALNNHSKNLMILQEQAATGQKVNRPSDAPADANRILDLHSELRSLDTDLSAIGEVTSRLNMASSVVQGITDQFAEVRSRLTSLLSGVQSGETDVASKYSAASQFNDILDQFVSMANIQKAGTYLFAGSDSANPPYSEVKDSSGNTVRVDYVGSYDERKVKVAAGVEVASVIVGEKVFNSDRIQDPVFYGDTGASAGTATSSVRGTVWLDIKESAVPGTYELSIDGGKTWTTASPPDVNTMVQNSDTGEVLYVNTNAISKAGTEPVMVPGTYDIFNALISMREMLNNCESLDHNKLMQMLDDTVNILDQVNKDLTKAFTMIGGREGSLENLKKSIEDVQSSLKVEESRLQDADIAEVSVDLAEKLSLYQMSMSVAGKLFNLSILDYLD